MFAFFAPVVVGETKLTVIWQLYVISHTAVVLQFHVAEKSVVFVPAKAGNVVIEIGFPSTDNVRVIVLVVPAVTDPNGTDVELALIHACFELEDMNIIGSAARG